MIKFKEFVDRKQREAIKQLKLVGKLLESQGIKVKTHIKDDDNGEPFIFVYNPNKNTFFEGIRVYKIGGDIAFRVQKDEKTQPFGTAYPIDVQGMFEDLIYDHRKPEDAGKQVIKAVTEEIKKFFKKSAEAEKDMRSTELGREPWNKVVIRSNDFGVDWANYTYAKA